MAKRAKEYDFVLVLSGIPEITGDVEDALFEAGCDDATLGTRGGTVYLSFTREAPSFISAVTSAIQDVRKAGIGADVLRIDECSLVTQADIARKLGVSRQMVHQYLTGERGPGDFPSPICHITEKAPLWYWCEVAVWLSKNGLIDEEQREQAFEAAMINNVLERRYQYRIEPSLAESAFHELERI
jgi:transcriptional regulator with XRE-family HTH domain